MRFKSMNVTTKLILPVLLCIVGINGALIAYTTTSRRNHAVSSVQAHALAVARDYSGFVKSEIEKALNITRTLAQALSAVKDPESVLNLGREPAKIILKKVLDSNPSFLAVFTVWEPDAFDLMDEAFTDLAGYDHTGRFIPYWTRDEKGKAVLEPAKDYESTAKGSYYGISRKTQNEAVIDPYVYTVRGRQLLMTSLVSPIIFENRFFGVAGIDLSLDSLQKIADLDKRYDLKAKISIISNNGTIAAVSDQPLLAGKRFDEVYPFLKDALSGIESGVQSIRSSEGNMVIFSPILIGNTKTPWCLNILIPTEVILAEATSAMWTEIIISTILTGLAILIIAFFIRWQIRPLTQIAAAAEKVALGHLNYDAIETADDEIGKVNASFKNMVMSLRQITATCQAVAIGDFSQRVAIKSSEDVLGEAVNLMVENIRKIVKQLKYVIKGDFSANFQPFSDRDQLGIALREMVGALRKMTAENERQNILKTGQMELHSLMRGEKDLTTLSKNVIAYLCEYLKAPIGAFYVMDEDEGILSLAGSFAYQKHQKLTNHFLPGEGLVGQAAVDKQRLLISDIPENYIQIQSGLGNATPRSIVVCPLVFENTVKGVIELGAFKDFSDTHLTFLDQVSSSIAIALNSAQARTRMKTLLEQTQKQADLLQHQQEALRKSNLELEQQASALKRSESRLQNQQEELRQTNEELQEQTQLLEEQKEDIQKKNLELEMAGKLIEEKAGALERTSRYKSEFLANMSHELRTPLNSILLLSKLISDNKDANLTEKQMEFARTIHASGSDLLILINEVLDLSKVESGKMELHLEPVVLSDLAEVMKRNFKPMAQKKRLDFIVELHDNLPASIVTDKHRTEQIIKNFLSNAFKFTASGRVSFAICPAEDVKVLGRKITSTAAIAFLVSDTGIGIPKDKQQLVFEAFKQADGTTNRKYGGTGLGLSISVELAKCLGGEIRLESQEGKGSAFILVLPAALDQSVYSEKKRPALEERPGAQSPGAEYLSHGIEALRDDRKQLFPEDKAVLIIEDDSRFANIFRDLSRAKAFKVLLADNGETGLHFADYHKPAAIVLKADLPGMDGWGVLNRLKETAGSRHTPVFLHTEKDLTPQQEMTVKQYSDAFVLQRAESPEKLADEVALFLHRIDAGILTEKQPIPDFVHDKEATLKSKRILLVDDDMRNVYAITNILEEKGMKVFVGKNGEEAIERLNRELNIDLVLMDIMMPVMDGYEAMKEIRKQKRFEKLPIIALTAKAMKGDRALCIKAGANDYLAKPFETEKLLSMLRVWLY